MSCYIFRLANLKMVEQFMKEVKVPGMRCFYDFQIAMGNVHSKMNIEQPSHQRIYKGMCHLSHTLDQYLILTMGEGEE